MNARILVILWVLAVARPDPKLRDGDIVFQTSRSPQAVAIEEATDSKLSHMGMILNRDGRPYVVEAIEPVSWTPLDAWAKRGVGGHYVVRRLRDSKALASDDAQRRLRAEAMKYLGRHYDTTFSWSDERLYCSELVWKVYDRALGAKIGRLQKLRDMNLARPRVRAVLRERYGDHVPLDEPVITPAAIFSSPALVTVLER